MNRIFEIEGIEPGTKLLMCEVSDRSAIRVAVEVNGVKVGISLDKPGLDDLFSLSYKMNIRDIQPTPANDQDGDA